MALVVLPAESVTLAVKFLFDVTLTATVKSNVPPDATPSVFEPNDVEPSNISTLVILEDFFLTVTLIFVTL